MTQDPASLAQIRDLRLECQALAEEKVALAQQAYELVEVHIEKLDKDLSAFTEHLQRTGQIPMSRREGKRKSGWRTRGRLSIKSISTTLW